MEMLKKRKLKSDGLVELITKALRKAEAKKKCTPCIEHTLVVSYLKSAIEWNNRKEISHGTKDKKH